MQDQFLQIQAEDFKWTPNPGQCKMLDKIIEQTRRELEPYFVPKPLTFSNISKEERMAISSLRKREDITMKQADKGGAVVVWRKDLCISEAERQPSDATAYAEVHHDLTEENQIEISHTVKTMIKNFVLPSTACKLIHPCPKTSNIYMLPKIHKENCPGRPIVSTYDYPTVYISKFLDIILSPLVQELPSFIKDTPQFLQIINDLEFLANANHKPLLLTMDVTSLCTSIPHDGALKASKHFLDERSNQPLSTSTLLQLIEIVLKMNTFHFNGRYFSQKQGVAMVTKMGHSVACIIMGYLEELFFADYEHSTLMLYKRYIDYIVGAASCPEKELQCFIDQLKNFNSSIKYTYTISNNTVTFLDLQLIIDNDHIKSCAHFKPTDSHNYLLFSSSRPPSCKQSIPFSQLLRIKRCCSDNDDVITISNQVANYFSARQCPKHIVESANEDVHSIHREDILMPSSKKVSPDRIPLVLPFHPSTYLLRRIILKHYKTLMTDQDTKDIFKLLPITSYKRERNLCNHLVRASEPQPLIFSDAGTFSCKRRRCNTCKFVTNCSAIHIKCPRGSFNVTEPFTCISKNIVYGIIC